MTKLYVKIDSFDELSNSLIVQCASDETESQNPEDYEKLAYQPALMWPDVEDPVEIKKRLAQCCIHVAEQNARKEKLSKNPQSIEKYKNMVGTVTEYNIELDLLNAPL